MNELDVLVPLQWFAVVMKSVTDEPELVGIRLFYRALEVRDDGCRRALQELARVLTADPGDDAGLDRAEKA